MLFSPPAGSFRVKVALFFWGVRLCAKISGAKFSCFTAPFFVFFAVIISGWAKKAKSGL